MTQARLLYHFLWIEEPEELHMKRWVVSHVFTPPHHFTDPISQYSSRRLPSMLVSPRVVRAYPSSPFKGRGPWAKHFSLMLSASQTLYLPFLSLHSSPVFVCCLSSFFVPLCPPVVATLICLPVTLALSPHGDALISRDHLLPYRRWHLLCVQHEKHKAVCSLTSEEAVTQMK